METFEYLRYMRDGSVKVCHGIRNDPKRVRTGKTARKRAAK